jgi:hypothetical protein
MVLMYSLNLSRIGHWVNGSIVKFDFEIASVRERRMRKWWMVVKLKRIP